MIVQFVITSPNQKTYPTSLKGQYVGKLVDVSYLDSDKKNKNYLLQINSSQFTTHSGARNHAIIIPNHPDHHMVYGADTTIGLNVNNYIDFSINQVAGTDTFTPAKFVYCLITLDVEQIGV